MVLDEHTALYGGVFLIGAILFWLPGKNQLDRWKRQLVRRSAFMVPISLLCLAGYLLDLPALARATGMIAHGPSRLLDFLAPIFVFMVCDLVFLARDPIPTVKGETQYVPLVPPATNEPTTDP